MKNVIERIAKEFNNENITWAIGGAYLLNRYGIENDLTELDIMVSSDSVSKANGVMSLIAETLRVENNEHFQTESYSCYQIEDITINIINNLKCDFNESFTYQFDKEDINSVDIRNNEKIYFSHLMDWFVIYQEINNEETTNKIKEYYNSGAFIDNSRLESKFGKLHIPNVKNSISSFKKRIYQVG